MAWVNGQTFGTTLTMCSFGN